jgi:F0F1-type ATP synthase assembly protein I
LKTEPEFTKISNTYKQIGPYLGLGTQLAATVVLMFFLGRWLDEMLSTMPLFIILFSLAGSSAGIYNFIKAVLNLNKKKTLEK